DSQVIELSARRVASHRARNEGEKMVANKSVQSLKQRAASAVAVGGASSLALDSVAASHVIETYGSQAIPSRADEAMSVGQISKDDSTKLLRPDLSGKRKNSSVDDDWDEF